jgi:hypothetical protein
MLRDSVESLDYVGLRVAFFRSFADAYRGLDVLSKSTRKVYFDIYRGLDRALKMVLKRLVDVSSVHEYLIKGVLKAFVDASVVGDYLSKFSSFHVICQDISGVADYVRKLLLKRLVDSYKAVDWFTKTAYFVRVLADMMTSSDYISKFISKSVSDWFVGEHLPVKGVVTSVSDVGRVLELLILGIPRHVDVSDVLYAVDFLSRYCLKAFFDVAVMRDAPYRIITLSLRDWFAGEHVPVKSVAILRRDSGLAAEYVMRGVGRKLVETVGVSDVVIKDVVKRLVESMHVSELVSKLSAIVFEDAAKTADIVAKVGFKLAGYDVRRVYFLPTEFKAWWDLISSQDHNIKIEVCKSLLEAFKRVRDKLGE